MDGGAVVTRAEKGQKILDACLAAQRGGSAIYGIGGPNGLTTWTGMSHGQVWDGLNWLRDYATRLGADLISCTRDGGARVYRVGDEQACREWAVDRMKYIITAGRRAEEIMTAVAQNTGRAADIRAARQLDRAVTELDRAMSDLLAAI
jgi:hypothetical protein